MQPLWKTLSIFLKKKKIQNRGTWLTQKSEALDVRVMRLSSTLGVESTLKMVIEQPYHPAIPLHIRMNPSLSSKMKVYMGACVAQSLFSLLK